MAAGLGPLSYQSITYIVPSLERTGGSPNSTAGSQFGDLLIVCLGGFCADLLLLFGFGFALFVFLISVFFPLSRIYISFFI